jgi:hypothetical protein
MQITAEAGVETIHSQAQMPKIIAAEAANTERNEKKTSLFGRVVSCWIQTPKTPTGRLTLFLGSEQAREVPARRAGGPSDEGARGLFGFDG